MNYLLFLILFSFAFCSHRISSNRLLEDIQFLSSDSLKGRKTGTPENRLAASFIVARFKSLGLKSYTSDYLQPFLFTTEKGAQMQGVNVVGYVPGSNNDVLVISAHYDHVGVVNGQIFNGADDNASGTAGLLALAAHFAKQKPHHTLLFVAFDAEEMGLQGSKAFVSNPPVPLQAVKANINMDMISHNDKGELYVAGTYRYPQLKPFLTEGHGNVKLIAGHDDPKLGHDDWTEQSDHGSFHKAGIPFLYFGVEDHKDYHKETDEYDNINKAFFIDAVEAIKRVIATMDEKLNL